MVEGKDLSCCTCTVWNKGSHSLRTWVSLCHRPLRRTCTSGCPSWVVTIQSRSQYWDRRPGFLFIIRTLFWLQWRGYTLRWNRQPSLLTSTSISLYWLLNAEGAERGTPDTPSPMVFPIYWQESKCTTCAERPKPKTKETIKFTSWEDSPWAPRPQYLWRWKEPPTCRESSSPPHSPSMETIEPVPTSLGSDSTR